MDPPDAYIPQNIEAIAYEKLHPFMQELIEEHKTFTQVLSKFEEAMITWRKNNWIFTEDILPAAS